MQYRIMYHYRAHKFSSSARFSHFAAIFGCPRLSNHCPERVSECLAAYHVHDEIRRMFQSLKQSLEKEILFLRELEIIIIIRLWL